MQERPAPPVTVSGSAGGRPAEVLASGTDEERPPRSRRRTAAGVALAVVLLGGVTLSQGDERALPVPEPSDLALVETGGALSMHWGYGGRLDVALPLSIRNGGGAMTISSVALDGTALSQPAEDVPVVAGGRLPLTLSQAMSCPEGAVVPPDAALRLDVRRDDRAGTRWLALPDGVAASLGEALSLQCSALPLDQAVVLSVEDAGAVGDIAWLRVEADNIGSTAVQLLSVDAATGFDVVLTHDPESSTAALPSVLSEQPVVLRLGVSVADCAAIPPVGKLHRAGIADVGYDDGRGHRAAKAVTGDLPVLRALVERSCRAAAAP